MHKKFQEIYPMVLCAPSAESFIHNWKNYQNLYKKTKTTFCWKYLDPSQNNCEGLTQWEYFPLVLHLPIQLQTWRTWGTGLNKINVLMMTGKIEKLALSPWPSSNLQGKKIRMSGLNTAYWQFSNTPEDKFQDQWTLSQ